MKDEHEICPYCGCDISHCICDIVDEELSGDDEL